MSIKKLQPIHDSPVLTMPAKWVNLIDDGHDDNFDGFLGLIEKFSAQKIVPVPSHILQLVGLIFNSIAFLHPQTLPSRPDPVVLTGGQIAVRAYNCMKSIIETSGLESFLRALPGHSCTRDIHGQSHAILDLGIVSKEAFNYQGCHPFLKRLIDASCVWEFLLNLETSTDQSISPGGWDLLDLLTTAWEIDLKNHGILSDFNQPTTGSSEKKNKPCFPHLLRQFAPASASGFRLDTRLLDIIFEPFLPKSVNYAWGSAVNNRTQAQQLSMRLFYLLEQLDRENLLESNRLREDTVNRMRALETADLHIFVNILPLDYALRLRLLTRYIESITRAPSQSSPSVVIPSTPRGGVSKTSSPARSMLLDGTKSSTGLRRTHSRSSLKLEDRSIDTTVSTRGQPQSLCLSSFITQILPRPMLEIPTSKATSRTDPSILLVAESRYLSVLNVVLSSFMMMYKLRLVENDQVGFSAVREGRLRALVDRTIDKISTACGNKLNRPLGNLKITRSLLHRHLQRSLVAFESLASNHKI